MRGASSRRNRAREMSAANARTGRSGGCVVDAEAGVARGPNRRSRGCRTTNAAVFEAAVAQKTLQEHLGIRPLLARRKLERVVSRGPHGASGYSPVMRRRCEPAASAARACSNRETKCPPPQGGRVGRRRRHRQEERRSGDPEGWSSRHVSMFSLEMSTNREAAADRDASGPEQHHERPSSTTLLRACSA